MKEYNKEKMIAVVIADDHYNSLGMIRSLGLRGIPVVLVLISNGRSFVDKSKYVTECYKINRDEIKILETLQTIISRENKYAFFPLSDFAADILDRNYLLFDNVLCPHAKGDLKELMNKDKAKKIASACGLRVPKGKVIVAPFDVNWSEFPVVLKPLASMEGLKSDIVIVNNGQELCDELKVFFEKGYQRILLEEYICGADEHMIEVMGERAEFHDCTFAGIISKVREFPIKNGSTSYASIVRKHQDIDFDKLNNFIKQTGFIGLFDMEFKYANGEAYFIECNFRNGAPGHEFTKQGFNIPSKWIDEMMNYEVSKVLPKECRFMVEQMDILNVLKRDTSIMKWLREFLTADKLFWDWKDMKPCISYYIEFIRQRRNSR